MFDVELAEMLDCTVEFERLLLLLVELVKFPELVFNDYELFCVVFVVFKEFDTLVDIAVVLLFV